MESGHGYGHLRNRARRVLNACFPSKNISSKGDLPHKSYAFHILFRSSLPSPPSIPTSFIPSHFENLQDRPNILLPPSSKKVNRPNRKPTAHNHNRIIHILRCD